MPTLRETQQRFFELITAPEDVGRTLERRGLSPAVVEEIVVGDERRSAVGRLDVYAGMYFFRLLEILKADHPVLAEALGDERFHNLATDYLQAHPSEHPSVRYVSSHLPAFLADNGWDPWMVELARLEQARVDCFDAPDETLLTLDDLRTHPDVATLPLGLIAAHRRLSCHYAVDEVEENQAVPPESPRTLLVWRKDIAVFHRVLEADEAGLLGHAAHFGEVCERLASQLSVEEAAARAFALLGRWVADGLLTRE